MNQNTRLHALLSSLYETKQLRFSKKEEISVNSLKRGGMGEEVTY